jgi:hypothetical protein
MKENKMIAGRQILFLIDHHFRMSEMDGGVYDTEHFFSVKMKGENLNEFITLWDDVLARARQGPGRFNLAGIVVEESATVQSNGAGHCSL